MHKCEDDKCKYNDTSIAFPPQDQPGIACCESHVEQVNEKDLMVLNIPQVMFEIVKQMNTHGVNERRKLAMKRVGFLFPHMN